MIEEDVAITTRVASSFLRVGQIELFGRRARKNEHKNALKELEMIVLHLIDREYSEVINQDLSLEEKIILTYKEKNITFEEIAKQSHRTHGTVLVGVKRFKDYLSVGDEEAERMYRKLK